MIDKERTLSDKSGRNRLSIREQLMDLLSFREPVNAWTHGVWMLLCIPAGLLLQLRCRGCLRKQIAFAIFTITLVFCFLSSCLYHAVRLPEGGIDWYMRLDYVGIFLLIAGTTTPVVLIVLTGWWRWGTLLIFWGMAAVGIYLRVRNVSLSDEVSTAMYIAMGWTGLLCYCELARRLSHRTIRVVVIGGVLYSVGAVINELKWPILWPGVIGAHELFHLLVMAASWCHFLFMLRVLVRHEQPEALPAPVPDSVPVFATEQAPA
jgi:hemolysin III